MNQPNRMPETMKLAIQRFARHATERPSMCPEVPSDVLETLCTFDTQTWNGLDPAHREAIQNRMRAAAAARRSRDI